MHGAMHTYSSNLPTVYLEIFCVGVKHKAKSIYSQLLRPNTHDQYFSDGECGETWQNEAKLIKHNQWKNNSCAVKEKKSHTVPFTKANHVNCNV